MANFLEALPKLPKIEEAADNGEKKGEKKEEESSLGDAAVVLKNLSLMEKEMIALLIDESLGGNAGEAEIDGRNYSCAAANFRVAGDSGEVLKFGNHQNIPRDIILKGRKGTFRVALDPLGKKGFFRIVDMRYDDRMSPRALSNLKQCAEEWNTINDQKK